MVPVARLARWAAASMPRARPETTAKPAAPRSRQPLGETQARGRGIARADDRDRRQMQHGGLAAHGKKRRGVVDHLQPGRIIGLPERHEGDAEGLRRLELPLGVLPGMDAGGAACTAAAGEIRQRRQRRAGAAVVVDQRAEGARTDIVAADEAKPIEPLLLAQPHAVLLFAHGMIRFGWRTRLAYFMRAPRVTWPGAQLNELQ